jgi:hypothetical protein
VWKDLPVGEATAAPNAVQEGLGSLRGGQLVCPAFVAVNRQVINLLLGIHPQRDLVWEVNSLPPFHFGEAAAGLAYRQMPKTGRFGGGVAITTWNYHAQRGWLDNKRYADGIGPDYTYYAPNCPSRLPGVGSAGTGVRLAL